MDNSTYHNILDETIESITIIDAETFEVVYANKSALEATKNMPNSYVGSCCYKAIHGEEAPYTDCLLSKSKNIKLGEQEIRELSYQGRQYRQVLKIIEWNNKPALLEMVEDITEKNTVLAMKDKLEEAKKSNQSKSNFLSTVSHDMRTPMNVILSLTELAEEENPSYDILMSYVKNIKDEGKFLLKLINDVLDVQKMESGAMELHPELVDLNTILNEVINQTKPFADKKGVNLTITVKGFIDNAKARVDTLRLQQLFTNLLTNAIKFTDKGGQVDLILENLWVKDGVARDKIIVRDTGCGMSDTFLQHLYDPFSQEDRGFLQENKGTGLGLSIVKQIVDIMGGTITCKSQIGKGTEFTIVLEAELVLDNVGDQKRVLNYTVKNDMLLVGRRILLCEDHPMNAKIVQKFLKRKGMSVILATNGQMGVDVMKAVPEGFFDAILMDVKMPVLNGIEATSVIRSLPREDCKIIPIIALTANAFQEDVKNCLEAGMNAHLSKPIDSNLLIKTLYNFLDFDKKIVKAQVLVVDDLEVNASVVAEAVRQIYDPIIVPSGAMAYDVLSSHRNIVAVITDVMMPEMSGLELIEKIRADHKFDNIVIIANTQFGDREQEEKLLRAGVDDFIYKPTTASIVIARLQNILSKKM